MSKTFKLTDLELANFVREVAAPTPAPGSGSVSAGLGALGASLVSMAFAISAGEGDEGQAPYVRGRAEELGALSERMLTIVDLDAAGFAAWRRSLRDPGGKDSEQARELARAAVTLPFEILENAVAGLRLAEVGAAGVRPALRTELTVGARALRNALDCAWDVVSANLAGGGFDPDFVEEHTELADMLRSEADRLLVRILEAAGGKS